MTELRADELKKQSKNAYEFYVKHEVPRPFMLLTFASATRNPCVIFIYN